MRPVTGGRWILGILVVAPMLVIQLIYVVLIVQAGISQAQLYAEEFTPTEYWVRSGAAGMLVRALLMLGLFCLFTGAVFGRAKDAAFGRTRTLVAVLAFAGWVCVMVVGSLSFFGA